MSALLKPYERLLRHWAERGLETQIGSATEAEIQALEERYDLTLPPDFRDYLLHAVPAGEWTDDDTITFWEMDRLKSIPDEYPPGANERMLVGDGGRYLVFADYLWSCWFWAISCGEENHGHIVIVGGPVAVAAGSFSDFVDHYMCCALGI